MKTSPRGIYIPLPHLTQKRNYDFANLNLLTIGKIITVAVFLFGGSYVFAQSLLMSKASQRRSILNKFEESFHGGAVPSLKRNVQFTRTVEMRFLKKFIDSIPTGPLVVLGPNQGAGQSVLIKEVLEARKISFYLNLRMSGVTSGEELIHVV